MKGIIGIQPKRAVEVIPYVVGRSSFVPASEAVPNGRDLFGSMGVDMRYGLTSNISLNATINPDFGQAEADLSVLNLGVFETFFSERCPFFVEGNSIFRARGPGIVGIDGPVRLFHLRRIGKRPGRSDTPDSSDKIDKPDGTTILWVLLKSAWLRLLLLAVRPDILFRKILEGYMVLEVFGIWWLRFRNPLLIFVSRILMETERSIFSTFWIL